mgnify:CR=1 FL=1
MMDYHRLGDSIWTRFKATKENQRRYPKAMVETLREAQAPDHLPDELGSLASEVKVGEMPV